MKEQSRLIVYASCEWRSLPGWGSTRRRSPAEKLCRVLLHRICLCVCVRTVFLHAYGYNKRSHHHVTQHHHFWSNVQERIFLKTKKADENWRSEPGSEFHKTSPMCERGEWRKQPWDFITQSLKQTPLVSCAISRLLWPNWYTKVEVCYLKIPNIWNSNHCTCSGDDGYPG